MFLQFWYNFFNINEKRKAIMTTLKHGFTLAETLITLAIIGVVAAITIPSLMQKTQDQELKTAWKKQYAMLSQTTAQLVADNGGDITDIMNTGSQLVESYSTYYKPTKKCDFTNLVCFTSYTKIKTKTGEMTCPDSQYMLDDGQFMLADGATIAVESRTSDPTNDRYLFVDVNGFKNPNTIGKDIFGVRVLRNKILPIGASDSITNPRQACFVTNTGFENSAKYLQE